MAPARGDVLYDGRSFWKAEPEERERMMRGLGYQLSQTLRELTEAARSFRALTNYLEQHPDAVLFGRGRPGQR
jgi:hypothetical protein